MHFRQRARMEKYKNKAFNFPVTSQRPIMYFAFCLFFVVVERKSISTFCSLSSLDKMALGLSESNYQEERPQKTAPRETNI